MNAKHIVAAFALIASAGAALADGPYPFNQQADQTAVASKTRAEVKAELAQARADGSIPNYSIDAFSATVKTASTVTRQQVRSELATAVHNGEINSIRHGYGS